MDQPVPLSTLLHALLTELAALIDVSNELGRETAEDGDEEEGGEHGLSGDVLDGPHDRFFDLGLGDAQFAGSAGPNTMSVAGRYAFALANAGQEVMEFQPHVLDQLHVGFFAVTQDAVGMAHHVVDGAFVRGAVYGAHHSIPIIRGLLERRVVQVPLDDERAGQPDFGRCAGFTHAACADWSVASGVVTRLWPWAGSDVRLSSRERRRAFRSSRASARSYHSSSAKA